MKRRGFIGALLASCVGAALPRKAVARKPETKEETPDFGSILRRLGPPDGIASFDYTISCDVHHDDGTIEHQVGRSDGNVATLYC